MQREERLWKSSSRGYSQVTLRENLAKASSPDLGQPGYTHSTIWPTAMFFTRQNRACTAVRGYMTAQAQHEINPRDLGRHEGVAQHNPSASCWRPGCSWASRAELFSQPNFRKHRHQESESLKPKEVCAMQTLQVSVPSPLMQPHIAPMEIKHRLVHPLEACNYWGAIHKYHACLQLDCSYP